MFNNRGRGGYSNYGGYGGYGNYGGNRNGGNSWLSWILTIIILGGIFFWYQNGGKTEVAKHQESVRTSQMSSLKKKSAKNPNIRTDFSDNVNQYQQGQDNGTTAGQSYTNQGLLSLKYTPQKYPNNYANLGSATFTDFALQQAQAKNNGKSWYQFAPLDNLGRSGYCQAYITSACVKLTSEMKRPPIPGGENNPSGWGHNSKVYTGTYHGYLYNKSHSIAWSLIGYLGGPDDSSNQVMNRRNLTTGTRAQNVGFNGRDHHGPGGMAYGETIIRNYLKGAPNRSVYYTVDPIYEGDELLPRGSHVMAKSIGDNQVNLNLYVFNTQAGFKINYQNGEFSKE